MKEQKIEDCNSTLIEFQFNYINVIETGTSQTNPPNRTDIWTHKHTHISEFKVHWINIQKKRNVEEKREIATVTTFLVHNIWTEI